MGTPGTPPPDYKFLVFDGKVALIDMHMDRYTGHQTAALPAGLVPARCIV